MNPPSRKTNGKKRKRKHARGLDKDESTTGALPSPSPSSSLFLTPQCPGFQKHVRDHYGGFVHCSADDLQPNDFHHRFRAALERLRDAQYYQYDVVMPGGKHSSRTFVKRTLVGEPGITYKYLGLRLFAHAWSGPLAHPFLKSIEEMNQNMIKMTQSFAADHGNCIYNLSLINYMEPTTHTSVGFKDEATYGMGKVSVSWHADSSLESGSSIGVYHCLPTQRKENKWDWRIGLKNNKSEVKPIVINTKDGDAYFLLNNFNETHQHCVLAGSQANRISSTHRVAVTQEDTYDYILKRVKIARKRFRLQMENISAHSMTGLDAKVIRYCQRVMTEVEMDWIAQYWLQGAEHNNMHIWWQRPMKTLEAYWYSLEVYTFKLYNQLCLNNSRTNESKNDDNKTVQIDVAKVLIFEFKKRLSLRQQWDERRADKIYQKRISSGFRPVERPEFIKHNKEEDGDQKKHLPKDLTFAVQKLTDICSFSNKEQTNRKTTGKTQKKNKKS